MGDTPHTVQRTYLLLLLFNTLAASLIWGVNTLFLLDAGLSNLEAFAANAFFTVGMVLFEIPTGVFADLRGRRASYLLGTLTLAVSTLLYLYMWQASAPFWAWAIASMCLGLGFTFFSGAVEAWLVDALTATGFKGKLETVFAKGQIVQGFAMLGGSVAGGFIAQITNLGVPYIVRSVILLITFALALLLMRDIGFKPERGKKVGHEARALLRKSVHYGLGNKSIRWIMLAAPLMSGVSIYVFYAVQPYLLELWGDDKAYSIAGLAAAIMAGAQITGGLIVPFVGRLFRRRTSVLLAATVASVTILALAGLLQNFWIAIILLVLWGLVSAVATPVRQSYLNNLIPSKQRATVLSFDSLLGSIGGVGLQPLLGKVADTWNYPASYLVSASLQMLALPLAIIAKQKALEQPDAKQADTIRAGENPASRT